MSGLRTYLLGLTAAGLVCAGILALCPKGRRELLRLCCACVLALAALTPLAGRTWTLPELGCEEELRAAVDRAVAKAESTRRTQAESALARDAEELAAAEGLTVTARVRCAGEGDAMTVQTVTLRGARSARLTALLSARFGITEGQIVWEE